MMEEDRAGRGRARIFFPNISANILSKVVDYCNRHSEDELGEAAAGSPVPTALKNLIGLPKTLKRAPWSTLGPRLSPQAFASTRGKRGRESRDRPFVKYVNEAHRAWDDEFINVDKQTLFGLFMAADFLEI